MMISKAPLAYRAILGISLVGIPSVMAANSPADAAHKEASHSHTGILLPSSASLEQTIKHEEAKHASGTSEVHAHPNYAPGHDHHAGTRFDTTEQEWKEKLKEGLRLERLGMDEKYESILFELKGPPYSDALRKDIYPLLEKFYEKRNIRVKLVEVYEEFCEKYPNDPELPEVYFRLGKLYKEFGAFELAQDRFYKVLSTSIRGARTDDEQKEFREKSLAAQIEVAELFLELGNYERAAQFFDRLLRLDDLDKDGSSTNRARVEFKRAYATYYHVKDDKDEVARNIGFKKVATYLLHAGKANQPFYDAYPENPHAAESHFLLASICKMMGTQADKEKAHEEVLKLIEKANRGARAKTMDVTDFDNKTSTYTWNIEKRRWEGKDGGEASVDALKEINRQIDLWVYWQKKAGNMLANAHFEEGETDKAIEIYQKMITLDPNAKWQAPIVYQLGLCFERLGQAKHNPKAIEAYEIITNADKNPQSWGDWSNKVAASLEKINGADNPDATLADVLQNQEQFIYRMAEWRLKNLRWNLAATSEIKRLEN